MGISYKSISSVMLATGLVLGMGVAQAAIVNFTLTGEVDAAADSGNVFGLNMFDTITATGTFDDSVLTAGTGMISFGSGSGNSLTLNVGSQSYTAADDTDYAVGFPQITLNAGAFTGFSFATLFGTYGSFDSQDYWFDGYDDNFNLVSGTWINFETAAVVPVPAAVWLFGSGLLGLVGVARRKQSR